MTWRRWFSVAAVSLVTALSARPAVAQLAPTGGHYANQSSDGGFAGSVNSSGGYGASVPLELPGARGGLPIPVQIVYGEHGVGAAGLGWDVPVSFVRRDTTVAHRRPMQGADGTPQARERVSLVLDGRTLELVRSASGWVARRDAPDILVREQSDGTWIMFDGRGQTYLFTTVSSALTGANLWLLKTITGVGGSQVSLDYNITTPTVSGGTGIAIDLTSVSYNPHPTTANCFKNQVVLGYDSALAAPLSLSMLGDRVLARVDKLTTLDVYSKATCSDANVKLRGYTFGYQADVDTQLPRLHSVQVVGRDGTPEVATPIPVASYDYGHANSGGVFGYVRVFQVAGSGFVRPATKTDPSVMPPSGQGFSTWSKLLDITGDGIPDNLQFNGTSLKFLRDLAHAGTPQLLSDGVLPNKPIETRTVLHPRYQAPSNVEQLWRQAIDVNGDGRIDFVDGSEEVGRWVVYLNLPNPSDPSRPRWARRSYSTQALAGDLQSRGFAIDPNHVPLSQRTTSHEITTRLCWHWFPEAGAWDTDPSGFNTHKCSGNPGHDYELTFTEWELTDINGDGYPDVVFNSSPLVFGHTSDPFPSTPGGQNPNLWTVTEDITTFELPVSNAIDVAFNVLGVHLDVGSQPFSGVVAVTTNDRCGVAEWTGDRSGSVQSHSCGIVDVNGDGIPDRVSNQNVYFGTGSLAPGSYFTHNVILTLPGPLAMQRNEQATKCAPPATGTTTFTTRQTAGLHDLNGDGIPDYVASDAAGNWTVRLGTGTGFIDPVPVGTSIILGAVPLFALSEQTENCAGTLSTTTAGLYDLDGDGQPEVLGADGTVAKLAADGVIPRAYSAGRLVQIDNGFGESTLIVYDPAKQVVTSSEPHDQHQVPFPEVVVSLVQTASANRKLLLANVQYAYGGAELVFDPVADRFTFPGYRRQVSLTLPVEDMKAAIATITDRYEPTDPTDPYDLGSVALSDAGRYARYVRIGQVSDVTVLSGDLGFNAPALVATDVTSNTHRIVSTHYEYGARSLVAASDPQGPEPCPEMVFPYDYRRSLSDPRVDACASRGFVFETSVQSSRGAPGAEPGSVATVTTRSEVLTVDNFGRPTSVKQLGDLSRADDDLCVETVYAEPTGTDERVLSAIATQTVKDCGTTIYASDTWQYDKLAIGQVSAGLPTAHVVDRRDDTGALRGTVREFEASFTPQGNPVTVSTVREDGAAKTTSMTYDAFALAPTIIGTQAAGLPKLRTDFVRDPLTLNITNARDPNLTFYGTVFDGFDRPIMFTVTPPGKAEGVLSFITYQGFTAGDSQGRRITSKVFTDPVARNMASTATGRTSTVYLDELGRVRLTEAVLGTDYPNLTMRAERTYDSLGRLLFAADPYPSTQTAATAYGTTRYFNADGTPACFIRGKGKQPRPSVIPMATDEASEIYPTCFSHTFQDHTEVVGMRDSASLLSGSPQDGVTKTSYVTAIGRLLARATLQGNNRLEYATFAQDRLGHLAGLTRYQDAASGAMPVTSSWHTNSLGQVIELDEPGSPAQFNVYSNWGELLETNRTADGVLKRVLHTYDALGRVIHSEEQNGGVVDPETVHDYAYDTGVQVAPQVSPTNVLGRLAKATWPSGSVTFSYDGLGRNNAKVFTDGEGGSYVEKHTFHGDGSLDMLDLFLPDTAFADEQIKYTFDSAGRGTIVNYTNSAGQRELYKASTIDAFGRVRAAKYGPSDYTAEYADLGRRLMTQVSVSSTLESRKISYGTFDPVGRERSRTELQNGSGTSTTTNWTYDVLGRLATAQKTGATQFNQAFTYDPLGNLSKVTNPASGAVNTKLTYSTTDRDRICNITFGSGTDTACNVTYDELGGISSQPTPTGTRNFTYLVDGSVGKITDGQGNSATFHYDAFGQVQQLDTTNPSADERHERHFGSLITLRRERVNGSPPQPVFTRRIPLHDGSVATRHGTGDVWTFEYGEQRGNRFFTDQNGKFVQDVDYEPFGKASPTGAPLGDQFYSSKQWNSGDSLAALGVSQLGARMYDPAIGRFTSRDPLLIMRTAATSNPYAFANNDPVNSSDPTGLSIDCDELNPACAGPDTSGYRYWDTSDAHGLGGSWNTPVYIGHKPPPVQKPPHQRPKPKPPLANPLQADTLAAISAAQSVIDLATQAAIGNGSGGAPDDGLLSGIGDGLWGMASGAWHMVRHPIDTVGALAHMARHPIETTKALASAAYNTVSACFGGNGYACGKVIAGVAPLLIGGELVEVSDAVELIDGAEVLAQAELIGAKAVAKEGIYEFAENGGKYVGQSVDMPRRILEHINAGRVAKASDVTTTEVLGGKLAREITEHRRIQDVSGGVPARFSGKVTNKVDPIGPKRRHLLEE